MVVLHLACVALAFFGLSQAQCVGRIQYPICAPAKPVTPITPVSPVSIPVTISIDKCGPCSSSPARATVCTDDISTLLLLSTLGNQNQPQTCQSNAIDADQLINKLVNALVYATTCGNCNNGGGNNGGSNNGGGKGNNGGGNGGNKDNDRPIIDVGLLRPGLSNVAEVGLGSLDLLGLGVGAGNSKGGIAGFTKDLVG